MIRGTGWQTIAPPWYPVSNRNKTKDRFGLSPLAVSLAHAVPYPHELECDFIIARADYQYGDRLVLFRDEKAKAR
jgi:hypothetical protein